MAEPPKKPNEGNENTEKHAPYKIPEEYQFVDCYGRGSLSSQRVGYTLLSMLNYKTKNACEGTIKFPLPDSFFIPSASTWNAEDEFGLSEFTAKALDLSKSGADKQAIANDLIKAAGETSTRYLAKAVLDTQIGKGLLRSQGLAYNPNKQMYYAGPEFGTQPFSFKLMPRNAKEALLMYEVCKFILRCTLPGSAKLGDEIGIFLDDLAKKMGAGNPTGNETVGNVLGFLNRLGQAPFFEYPNLWNIAIFVTQEGRGGAGHRIDKCVFEWKTLALVDYRIDFGTNIKWHADGFPTSVTVTMQFTETVLKTAANLDDQMPHIII